MMRAFASSAFVLCVFLAHTAMFRVYITDDAFIAFRYVRSFLHGNGLTYNAGERVWGYTSFLWCALLMPFGLAGIDIAASARVLGVIFNFLTIVVILTYPAPGMSAGARRWAALFLATNGAFVLQGVSGLETALFSLLLVLAIREYGTALERSELRRLVWVGVLAALITMTRPEGALLTMLIFLDLIVRGRRLFGAAQWVAVGRYIAGGGPLLAIYLVSMYSYYGSLWPNTLDAKVGLSPEQFLRGWHYLRTFLVAYPAHVVVLGVATLTTATAPAP